MLGAQARADVEAAGTTALPPRHRPPRLTPALLLVFLGLATFGFYKYRVAGWAVSDWCFAAAAGAIVVDLLAGRTSGFSSASLRRTPPALLAAILVFLTSGALASLWSLDVFGSMGIVLRLAWITLIWLWTLRAVAVDRRSVDLIIWGVKTGVLVTAFGAIAGYLGLITFTSETGAVYADRQPAFSQHPNQAGAHLAVGILFFLLDVRTRAGPRTGRALLVRLLLIGVVAFALATTGSMTAAAAAVIGGGVVLVALRYAEPGRRPRHSPHARALLAMGVMVVGAVGLFALANSGSPVVDRFTAWISGDESVGGSVESREVYVDFVIERIDRVLLVGVGLDFQSGTFDPDQVQSGAGHSLYFRVLYEAGLPAFFALVVITGLTLMAVWSLIGATRGSELFALAVVLLAAIVAANVVSQASPGLTDRTLWLPIALTGSLSALYASERQRRDAPTSPQGPAGP